MPLVLRSPWRRAYVERLIGTIRQECVDHLEGGVRFAEDNLLRYSPSAREKQ